MSFSYEYINPDNPADQQIIGILAAIKATLLHTETKPPPTIPTFDEEENSYQGCLYQLKHILSTGRGRLELFKKAGYTVREIRQVKALVGKSANEVVKKILDCPFDNKLIWSYSEDSGVHQVRYEKIDHSVVWQDTGLTEAQAVAWVLRAARNIGILED